MIVTYNSSSVLPGLLDSLPAGLEGLESYQVIVVDNASQDLSVDIALTHPIAARIIRMTRNAGYSAGINAATATIGSDWNVLILNPDIRLYPGAARILNDRLADTSVGIVVPQVLDEDGSVSRSVRREPSLKTAWADALIGSQLAGRLGLSETVFNPVVYREGGQVEWAVGAILAVGARTRSAVGDWDESFFLYSEEVDYQERVRRAGLAILYEARARAIHIGGEFQDNPFLCSLMSANRIRYYRRRHGALATMMFRLGVIAGETVRIPLGQRHRAALRGALAT
ncbi:glycosyltransferase [Sinorhizobium chiapasense]|uniref:Glycosyltransferase n=1 Tax=Sinorhizobium chiapasense TaxID=501572 RepID=A0ABZ2BHS9_9HYPH